MKGEIEKLKYQKKILETYAKYQKSNPNRKWNELTKELNEYFNENTPRETWRSRFNSINSEYLEEKKFNSHKWRYNYDVEKRLLGYLKQDRNIDFLIKSLELEEIEILGYIEKLRNKGHEISNTNGLYKLSKNMGSTNHKYSLYEGELTKVKFGVVSDTHFGSKQQQETLLNLAYEDFEKNNIITVLHCGDISDGLSHRPEHKYEVFALGADEQAEYIIQNYPKKESIKTYFILGNHDGWHFKNGGVDIGKVISNSREDMIYLGSQQATVVLNNCKVRLFHPLDGSCFDDKTEIITKNGWKLFKDITYNDELGTMTKDTNEFQWQKPNEITNEDYNGKMYHFNSRTVDCMVTPNHKMWIKRYDKSISRKENLKYPTKSHPTINLKWQEVNAKDIYDNFSRQKFQMTRVIKSWKGKDLKYINVPYIESKNKGTAKKMQHIGKIAYSDYAELVAWYVTEGHARPKEVNISQYQNINPKNYNQIIELFNRIGCRYQITKKYIRVGSIELSSFIKKECGHLSKNKFIPAYLKNSSCKILKIIFDTMIKGDGWINNKGYGYRSISKQLRQDFIEISIKLGYAVSEYKDTISVSKIQVNPTINTKPEELNYDGKIYCVNVDNELILVRRNGKILWTHNSYAISYSGQKSMDVIRGGEKPNIILCGHHHKMGYFIYRNIHYFEVPSFQGETPFIQGKRLSNDVGYYIIEADIDTKGNVIRMTPTLTPFYKTIENDYKIINSKVYKKELNIK